MIRKKNKRSQSDMITTILLILVALAAVILIALFIMNQVRTGTSTAESRAQCIKVGFALSEAKAGGTISVMRTDNERINVTSLKVIVGGVTWNSTAPIPAALETVAISGSPVLTIGQKVEIGVILQDNTACASIAGGVVST